MKKYAEIYRKIRDDITSETIKYGSKLPSKRAAADVFDASVITVEHAYELLESEGYVEAKARSGYYVCYLSQGVLAEKEFPRPFKANSEDDKSVLTPDRSERFPFLVYASAVRTVLSEYGEKLTEKTERGGATELKTAIKNYLKTSRDVTADEDRIVIGSGAEYLYGIIAKLLGENTSFAVESPSFGAIESIYAANGVKIEKLRLGKDGVLSEDLRKCRAKLIHLTPYRSFPTGVTASASKRAEYLFTAKKIGAYIVEDDYESEFSLSAKLTETLFKNSADDNVIYVNTFSKTIFPAMRLAYMILPKSLVGKYREIFGSFSCPVPTLEQYVTAKLINDGSFARHVNRVRRSRRNK